MDEKSKGYYKQKKKRRDIKKIKISKQKRQK